jgi:hypothetical protein
LNKSGSAAVGFEPPLVGLSSRDDDSDQTDFPLDNESADYGSAMITLDSLLGKLYILLNILKVVIIFY